MKIKKILLTLALVAPVAIIVPIGITSCQTTESIDMKIKKLYDTANKEINKDLKDKFLNGINKLKDLFSKYSKMGKEEKDKVLKNFLDKKDETIASYKKYVENEKYSDKIKKEASKLKDQLKNVKTFEDMKQYMVDHNLFFMKTLKENN